jgi:hypothetical protein
MMQYERKGEKPNEFRLKHVWSIHQYSLLRVIYLFYVVLVCNSERIWKDEQVGSVVLIAWGSLKKLDVALWQKETHNIQTADPHGPKRITLTDCLWNYLWLPSLFEKPIGCRAFTESTSTLGVGYLSQPSIFSLSFFLYVSFVCVSLKLLYFLFPIVLW